MNLMDRPDHRSPQVIQRQKWKRRSERQRGNGGAFRRQGLTLKHFRGILIMFAEWDSTVKRFKKGARAFSLTRFGLTQHTPWTCTTKQWEGTITRAISYKLELSLTLIQVYKLYASHLAQFLLYACVTCTWLFNIVFSTWCFRLWKMQVLILMEEIWNEGQGIKHHQFL